MGGFLVDQIVSDSVKRGSSKASLERPNEVSVEDTICDFTFCAPRCCQELRSMKIILFLLCWCGFVQSSTTNGFVNSVITTLEKRYHLTSTESGAIASLYDIGCALVLLPLSYYGGTWRRLRVLSLGMLVVSSGCFLFALPQAIGGKYVYNIPTKPMCYRNSNVSYDFMCDKSRGDVSNYMFAFWIAHFLVGVGASPLYTLGIAYMDENLPTESSALYIGILHTTSLIGATFGYILAASVLEIYVDVGSPHPGLTMANREIWVGAWWLTFILSGTMALAVVIPLYGFPKELPETTFIRAKKKSEAFGNTEAVASRYVLTMRDFLRNTILLLKNPTFMLISLSKLAEGLMMSGFSTFGPKFLETLFYLPSSQATRSFGMVLVPGGGLGMFLGGLAVRVFKLSMRSILKLQFYSAALVIPFICGILISCDPDVPSHGIAGISRAYSSTNLTSFNLTSACNEGCQCRSDSSLFLPMCGSNRITYYSPCYAGCSISSSSGYGNCSCISSNASVISKEIIKTGSCMTNCRNFKWFLVTVGLNIFLMFFIATPSLASTLRSVPEKQKTFALGVQWIIIRVFGSIPGPLVFGKLIDSACILWNEKCEMRGGCAFYNGSSIRNLVLSTSFILKSISVLSLLLAWLSYKKTKAPISHAKSSDSILSHRASIEITAPQ